MANINVLNTHLKQMSIDTVRKNVRAMNPILINGIGTVGSRIAHLLLSAHIPIHGVKFSASKDDIKSQEILALYKSFGAFPLIAAQGDNLDQRTQQFKNLNLNVESHDLTTYSVVIDGTDGDVTKNNVNNYKKHNQKFLIQGGSDPELTNKDFVSAPNSVSQHITNFPQARQVSCNTTFGSTALGVVLNVIPANEIQSVEMELHRRCRDPGEKKEMKESLELKTSHHAEDVMSVLPQLHGKVTSKANVNAWEHFHHTQIIINFTKKVNANIIANQFKTYPRCIVVNQKITEDARSGMNMLMDVSKKLNVTDADTLLPIYSIHQVSDKSIMIRGFTPQRSIIALSCIDWIWSATGKHATWQSAFDATNRSVKWHGHSIADLKKGFEEKLK